jgi:hypothetical protein
MDSDKLVQLRTLSDDLHGIYAELLCLGSAMASQVDYARQALDEEIAREAARQDG